MISSSSAIRRHPCVGNAFYGPSFCRPSALSQGFLSSSVDPSHLCFGRIHTGCIFHELKGLARTMGIFATSFLPFALSSFDVVITSPALVRFRPPRRLMISSSQKERDISIGSPFSNLFFRMGEKIRPKSHPHSHPKSFC